MEPVAALEGRSRLLLVLRVDLDQRGVDVQDDRPVALGRLKAPPDLLAHLGKGTCERCSLGRRDLVERPGHRRVRGNRSEQVVVGAQELDVEAALATTSQHERHLHEHLAPVVDRNTCTSPWQARRERITEPQPVGKGAKGVQPDVGRDAGPTGFHHDATGAVSVHFGDALLVRDSAVSATTVSPTWRAIPRTRADQLKWRREEAEVRGRPARQNARCVPGPRSGPGRYGSGTVAGDRPSSSPEYRCLT